jgi:hypothetical protein
MTLKDPLEIALPEASMIVDGEESGVLRIGCVPDAGPGDLDGPGQHP